MKEYEKIEDKFIDIYCRLEYDIWYQGYKDDVSQLLKETPLYDALPMVAKSNPQNKTIKISGEHCNTNEKLQDFIEDILSFLEDYEDYKVIFALPYEKQKLANSIAYKETMFDINIYIVSEEMDNKDYVLQIYQRIYRRILCINLYSDKSIDYATATENSPNIIRGHFKIKDNLYTKVYNWAKKYLDEYKITHTLGFSNEPFKKYDVYFGEKEFEKSKEISYLFKYKFDKIEGNGALTELLQLPELKVLFEESDDDL